MLMNYNLNSYTSFYILTYSNKFLHVLTYSYILLHIFTRIYPILNILLTCFNLNGFECG